MVKISGKKLVVLVVAIAMALVLYVCPVWAATGNSACCPDGGQIYANRLQVYVYDLDTNLPIKGATVSITGPGMYQVSDITGSRGSTGTLKGASIPGAYTVTASAPDYDQEFQVITLGKYSIFKCEPRIIRIGLTGSCDRWIKVCVDDKSTGQPIEDVPVQVCVTGTNYNSCRIAGADGCTENFGGIFKDNAIYTVTATADGYKPASKTATFGKDDCGQLDVSLDLEPCEPVVEVCVYEKGTNTQIPIAQVTLTGPAGYSEGPEATVDGCIEFDGDLPAGSYTANVTAEGYKPGSASKVLPANACDDIQIRVDLEPCRPVVDVCVYIKGTNTLIPGAKITLTGPGYAAGPVTSASGCHEFTGALKPGSYTATATAEHYNSDSETKALAEGNCDGIEIRLELEICDPEVKVCVYDKDTHKLIPGASVTLTGPGSYNEGPATAAEGCVEFDGDLLAGIYTASATADGYKPGNAAKTLEAGFCGELPIVVELEDDCVPTVTVYVYDVDTNKPINGATVELDGPGSYWASDLTKSTGWTDEFKDGLVAGLYEATATKFGYGNGTGSVVMGENECGNLEIRIGLKKVPCEESRTLHVYVYDKSTGLAIRGAEVEVTGPGGYSYTGVTNSVGKIILTGPLYDGTYRASVKAFTSGSYNYKAASKSIAFYSGVCGRRDINIGLESDCVITDCVNTFQVTVYENDGTDTPIPGVRVEVTGPGSYFKYDETGSSGRTSVLGGANVAGDYTITAAKSGYEAATATVSTCGNHVLTLRLTKIEN